ncbi:hypothetical protein ACJO2E_12135 [Marinobacter sp. M1N3S26]|uniref:hypothetical protein n=1 Tax=Marinobacter sp. M1N3S26 TaxID=3382299 RepID=UPI00387ADD18
MDWDRFHFLCRHYQASPGRLLPGGTDCHQEGELTALGTPLPARSLGAALLRRLQGLPPDTAEPLLSWYGEQDFSPILAPPPRVRGVLLYLSALSLVLGFMMAIYHLVLLPRMREFYTSVEVPGTAPAFAMIEQGSALLGVVVVLLVLVWLLAWQVRRLYRFPASGADSLVLRWMPGGIGRRYRELADLIQVPVAHAVGESPGSATAREYLACCQGRVPGPDLPRLIRRQAEELARRVVLCLQVAVALVGVLIALGIGLFLAGAYSPIFSTGAIV